jgi:trk system potassium uptake protein TrkA
MDTKHNNVIIAGSGRFGSILSGKLSSLGYDVMVIDKNSDGFRKLPDNFSGYTILGDATDVDVLEVNDIRKTDMLIACTEDDNVNLLIGQIASKIFDVPEVYIRLNNEEKTELISELTSKIKFISPQVLCVNEFQKLSGIEF